MKKITLTNNFHDTECTVLSNYDDVEETWFQIQADAYGPNATAAGKAKYRRIKNTLCGSRGCQCGTVR